MDFEIRESVLSDAEQLIEHKLIVTKENPDTLATLIENHYISINEQEETIENVGPNDYKRVAVVDGKIVGIINMKQDLRKKFEHIAQFGISVQQEYAGMGIGSRLIENALEFAKSNEFIEKVMLTVFSNNTGAIRLYERFGFEKEATLTNQVKLEEGYTDLIYMTQWIKK
ncbi:GNAT family N-acetyltransferase [Phocicoccus pinnipedialis]|uniref:Putative acetyltransferase YhhY n=1 Tax=Phocicoccus pinnipedialis TaxID=110845 RepID=A0A6V7R3W0_9BACL|nr:GNAT family N-acetyltransferase [Jeotgalicoccus pinnipedialis]MBP1939965.1 ribosomal protein S18 acetylase RimI-like enzyme [Jeotgalicoccus pinnipedialis]CAD2072087.1 putative acetyltransferase YhhY [Jeotgalicoccus pinnipedialis]